MKTESTGLNWRQRASYHALRLLLLVLRGTSVRQCARLGAFFGGCAFRLMSHRRRNVVNNLRIIYAGAKSYEECEAVGREVFRRTGANLIGGMRAGLLPGDRLAEVVEVRGQEHMREALSKGCGAIALLGHMGPWELFAHLRDPVFLGGPFGSLYRPIDNPAVDALVRTQRGKLGARLFARKEGWGGAVGLLREGGVLMVLADQRAGGAGLSVSFFGRNVLTTRLPYVLHRKTGAPLVTMSAWTREPGKWVVQIHPPVFPEQEPMRTREEFTRRCNQLLENALRVSIEDGFWFHRRFRPEGKTFFPAPSGNAGGIPLRRALIVVPDDKAVAGALAKGLAAFARRRPQVSFVLVGGHVRRVGSEAGLSSASVVEGFPEVGQKEPIRRILEVDREGPVGIDGGLVLPGADVAYWVAVLEKVGLGRILAAAGETVPRGVRRAFSAPERPTDPDAWLAVFESVSETE